MGKSTINGPFSIAMLNYQRVLFLIHQNRAKSVGFSRIPLPAGGLPSCEEGLCRKPFFFSGQSMVKPWATGISPSH